MARYLYRHTIMCRTNYSLKTGPVSQNNFMSSIYMKFYISFVIIVIKYNNYLLLVCLSTENIMHWYRYIYIYFLPQIILHNNIHSLSFYMFSCRYLDSKQYMVYLFLSKYRNQLFYSCPVSELELFQLVQHQWFMCVGLHKTGNCIIKFLSWSIPNVTSFIS